MKAIFNLTILLFSVMLSYPANSSEFILIEEAYVQALPPSVQNTSAYMTIKNTSSEIMILNGANSESVASIMIHQSKNEGGMMSMVHIMALSIPPGGEVSLEPGGIHLMLMGLKFPLESGTTMDITLKFENDIKVPVSLPVRRLIME